jgi:hypothetical protein
LVESKSLRSAALVILFIWAVVQTIIYFKHGVQLSVDSHLYLKDAELLKSGSIQEGRSLWYLSYSFFLYNIFQLGGTVKTVVILQVLISGFSTYCVYLSAKKIFDNVEAAMLAALLHTCWLPLQEWNTFIYTESLFTSCGIFIFTALQYLTKPWHFLALILLFCFTFLLRPNGFALAVALIGYCLVVLSKKIPKWIYITIIMLSVTGVFFLLNRMLASFELIESYAKAEIIYPNLSLSMKAPSDLVIPPHHLDPLLRIIFFATENPVYFLKITNVKLVLFLANIKPYFSIYHNILIVLLLYPTYYYAFKAFRSLQHFASEKTFVALFIGTQIITVSLTTENWDGRFLIPLLPFIFILASQSYTSLINKFVARLKI